MLSCTAGLVGMRPVVVVVVVVVVAVWRICVGFRYPRMFLFFHFDHIVRKELTVIKGTYKLLK